MRQTLGLPMGSLPQALMAVSEPKLRVVDGGWVTRQRPLVYIGSDFDSSVLSLLPSGLRTILIHRSVVVVVV